LIVDLRVGGVLLDRLDDLFALRFGLVALSGGRQQVAVLVLEAEAELVAVVLVHLEDRGGLVLVFLVVRGRGAKAGGRQESRQNDGGANDSKRRVQAWDSLPDRKGGGEAHGSVGPGLPRGRRRRKSPGEKGRATPVSDLHFRRPLRRNAMLEVFNALFQTAFRFGREFGPYLAAGVLLFVAAGVALKVLARILPRGGPESVGRKR
jgi:hypothetical protein